jgi:hypothetical protein
MSNIWDYINSINHTKVDMMTDTENDALAEFRVLAIIEMPSFHV